MVEAWCPVCGMSMIHSCLLVGKKGYGDIYRCSGCQLARLLPVPTNNQHQLAMRGMYQQNAMAFSPEKLNLARRSIDGYLRHLTKMGRKINSVADLGGGLGYYSRAFAERGIKVTYVDVDHISATFVREQHVHSGVFVQESTIEDFCRTAAYKFDVVFLRHAIEHCIRPDEVLNSIRSTSHHKTVLVLETDNNLGIELLFHPSSRGYWRSLYRDHYNETSVLKLCNLRPLAVDQKETHYYAFRLDNLSRLLQRTGWRVLDKFCYSLGDPIYWPNLPGIGEYQWWIYRWNVRTLSHAIMYSMLYPLLKSFCWVSGLAIYATVSKDNQEESKDI